MISDHALTFSDTEVESKYDLETMQFDQLVTLFRTRFNTQERSLKLMDEWNYLSFQTVSNMLPNSSLEERIDQLLLIMGRFLLYLKGAISDFQHKCKLINAIRPFPEFNIARMHGD